MLGPFIELFADVRRRLPRDSSHSLPGAVEAQDARNYLGTNRYSPGMDVSTCAAGRVEKVQRHFTFVPSGIGAM
jgi:hypothetical protein